MPIVRGEQIEGGALQCASPSSVGARRERRFAPCARNSFEAFAQGASDVSAYITHGVLSGGAVARISSSKLKELVITDTILPTEAVRLAKNIRVITIAGLIGEAVARTAKEESVSSLFD